MCPIFGLYRTSRGIVASILILALPMTPAVAGGLKHHKQKYELIQGFMIAPQAPQVILVPVAVDGGVPSPSSQGGAISQAPAKAEGVFSATAPQPSIPLFQVGAPQPTQFNVASMVPVSVPAVASMPTFAPQPFQAASPMQAFQAASMPTFTSTPISFVPAGGPVQLASMPAAPAQVASMAMTPVSLVQTAAIQVAPAQVQSLPVSFMAQGASTLTPVQLLLPRKHCLFNW